MLFLGFSSGVPILLVFSTLSVWLREAGVERATIGFFSWAALAYGFKVVWAPLIDRLPVPVLAAYLGRRRAWLLVSQGMIIAALGFMALNDPARGLVIVALGAVALAFSSATQDIVIDAYRIESADDDLQGLMAAAYIMGYRIGMIVAGAGALELAGFLDVLPGYDYTAWRVTYLALGAVMGVGVLTTFVISEPAPTNVEVEKLAGAGVYGRFVLLFACVAASFALVFWGGAQVLGALSRAGGMSGGVSAVLIQVLRLGLAVVVALGVGGVLVRLGLVARAVAHATYIAPFSDFFARFGRGAILILLLIATYRIADIVMGVMANVFYVDLGFSKQEIGSITKFFGLGMTILGGFVGGLLTVRYGVLKILFLGGFLAAATNVLFAAMVGMGPKIWVLAAVVSADNVSGGIAAAAFVAYLSSLTSRRFTATQYALFSSLMLLLPKLIAGYSGVVVDRVGYAPFFIGTAALGVVPLALLLAVVRLVRDETKNAEG